MKSLPSIFLVLISGASLVAQEPVLPLPPAEVIKFLPPAPPGWETVRSTADNFLSDWVATNAVREYKFTPPPKSAADPTAPLPPPQFIRIRITDSGYWPQFRRLFEGFTPGKSGDAERLLIDSHPAIKVTSTRKVEGKDDEELARILLLVNNRFIVQLETTNAQPKDLEDWLKKIDFAKLARVPSEGVTEIPVPVMIVKIDELNPKKTRSYPLFWRRGSDPPVP